MRHIRACLLACGGYLFEASREEQEVAIEDQPVDSKNDHQI
jgi:hypothetical protein